MIGRGPGRAPAAARAPPATPSRSPPVSEKLQLVPPSARLEASYRGLVSEFGAAGEPPVPWTVGLDASDFGAFVAGLERSSRGGGGPPGFVPQSTFWLVRDGSEVVGVSNLRHGLTDALRREGGHIGYGVRPSARGLGFGTAILRLTLLRAAELGLDRVLLTCAKANLRSARVIVRNGGVLESEEPIPERGGIVQRYWISLGRGEGEGAAPGGLRGGFSGERNEPGAGV